MFQWEPDMIRFMKDASEYGDYNKKLGELIAPYLVCESHICDAGCGLGYLSLALASYAGQVTAVDINRNALATLEENLHKRRIDNINIYCGDISSLYVEEPFDHMVFCFFGNIWDILAASKRSCMGKVFLILCNYNTHRFSVSTIRKDGEGAESACQCLEEKNIPYERKDLSIEMGQPFRDLKDARLFFETYSQDKDRSLITDEFVRSRLVSTGREDFPLYMPHERKVSFITLEASHIPDSYNAKKGAFLLETNSGFVKKNTP